MSILIKTLIGKEQHVKKFQRGRPLRANSTSSLSSGLKPLKQLTIVMVRQVC